MDKKKDTYRTIAKPTEERVFKEKKSKFYGYAFPISTEDEVKPILDLIRKNHYSANHVCYAWQLGVKSVHYRANDDGEPNNSAGMPIYGQIQSFEITNVLVVVVRIFGGTKLGVGGLISAYRTSAQMALQAARIVRRTLKEKIGLAFSYSKMNDVMRIIKQQDLKIVSQKMALDCSIVISVRQADVLSIKKRFEQISEISVALFDENQN